MSKQPKLAIVHHWLVSAGGAEKVLYELHRMWPEAPIYTAAYDPKKFPELSEADVRTTWLDKVPFAKTKHQFFPMLRALAFKHLDLSAYDIVVSSDAAEAKSVKTGDSTMHICYCHTPIRYYWVDYDWYMQNPPFGRLNWLARFVLKYSLGWLKKLDYDAAQRVNWFVANSHNVKDRIKKYYQRESEVIYPPIDTRRFSGLPRSGGDYFLIVGRQVAYKRLDLAVDAFNELGLKLKVAGIGEAAGTPVIAYRAGGALEYVKEGVTGVFFDKQSPESLADAVRRFEKMSFDSGVIRSKAEKFGVDVFETKMRALVARKWEIFEKEPRG
jgi:glycosyltransferase involved in cell wall biosynthesis